MTTLALRQRSASHLVKSLALPGINWKLVYGFGIGALLLLLVFYIYCINTLTGGSYLIKNYNKEIQALQVQNSNLEAGFALSGFMGTVQEKAKELSFEKTTQVTYIEIVGPSLAKAQ